MTTQQQQILDKCKAVFAKAKELLPHLNFDHVAIRFDLKGRAAGIAGRKGDYYYMRFNADMLKRDAFDHVINETVPHEIAHICTYMDNRLGYKHDSGWARLCVKLGGTGERCHTEEVVYGKGLTYEYVTTTGHTTRVSQQIHTRLQQGQVRRFREKRKGELNKNCAHQVVGASGRTLAAPVRKVEAKAPVFMPADTFRIASITDTRNPGAPVVTVFPRPAAPVAKTVQPPVAAFAAGASKASISRSIMLAGYRGGKTYEEIITAMIAANGYDRQLARATFKANAPKVGIPSNWGM